MTSIGSVPDPNDMTARTRLLAQELLDEMDRPKSPEREVYEAQPQPARLIDCPRDRTCGEACPVRRGCPCLTS